MFLFYLNSKKIYKNDTHKDKIFVEAWTYETIRSLMFQLRFAERGRNAAGMAAFVQ